MDPQLADCIFGNYQTNWSNSVAERYYKALRDAPYIPGQPHPSPGYFLFIAQRECPGPARNSWYHQSMQFLMEREVAILDAWPDEVAIFRLFRDWWSMTRKRNKRAYKRGMTKRYTHEELERHMEVYEWANELTGCLKTKYDCDLIDWRIRRVTIEQLAMKYKKSISTVWRDWYVLEQRLKY